MREHIEVWEIRTCCCCAEIMHNKLVIKRKRLILFLKRVLTSSLTFVFLQSWSLKLISFLKLSSVCIKREEHRVLSVLI